MEENTEEIREDKEKRWFAVVNPASANGRTGEMWPAFRQKLKEAGWLVDYALTTGPQDAVSLTRAALERGERKIMAVGGDGTLNEVVNGFFTADRPFRNDAELAVLTHGTGSDFIRTLGIERGIDPFIEVLRRSQTIRVDVGRVEYQGDHARYFLNVADVGLGAEIAAKVNRMSKVLGGKMSFLLASISVILAYRNKLMTCRINGEIVAEARLNSVMVANGRYFGGGMMIAPNAELGDGEFEIVILEDFSTFELLRHLPKLYRGTHLQVPGVKLFRGHTVVVESEDKVLLEVDGEQPGLVPVQFSILPQALRLWR